MAEDEKGYDFSRDPLAEKPKAKRKPLPLTETLVLDIVDYMLANKGYGYSTQISNLAVTHLVKWLAFLETDPVSDTLKPKTEKEESVGG